MATVLSSKGNSYSWKNTKKSTSLTLTNNEVCLIEHGPLEEKLCCHPFERQANSDLGEAL